MIRRPLIALCCLILFGSASRVSGQGTERFNGVWTLNRTRSELPRDLGFNPAWLGALGDTERGASSPSPGGRGGRGGGAAASPGLLATSQESYEEAKLTAAVTAEARNPSARVTIVDLSSAVVIVNELGEFRTLHLTGKEESIEVGRLSVPVRATREADRLVVSYRPSGAREVRYTYSVSASPAQLVVDVQFFENGPGPKARRVYEPAMIADVAATGAPPVPQLAPAPAAPAAGTQAEALDQRPQAELRGLKTLGVVIEDPGQDAVACGLNRDALERAFSKQLMDGGFTVSTRADEEAYVYVNVMSSKPSSDSCVSRYDVYLYTHATTRLPHHDQPVLVQVLLLHHGGIGSSTVAGHAGAVTRALQTFVGGFISQIRSAND